MRSKGIIIGIPKTIDNDLCAIDHTSGFGSAAKYVAASVLEIAHDTAIYKLKSVTIVEIMGRDAGWLTAASALARNQHSSAPHLFYLPEVAFDKEAFLDDVSRLLKQRDNVVVAVSEGIRDQDGNYISDINEAYELGRRAVLCAETGKTAVMTTPERVKSQSGDYDVLYGDTPVERVANQVKHVPLDYINGAHNDVTDQMVGYLRPLIQGEVQIPYQDGLPEYADISHLYDE